MQTGGTCGLGPPSLTTSPEQGNWKREYSQPGRRMTQHVYGCRPHNSGGEERERERERESSYSSNRDATNAARRCDSAVQCSDTTKMWQSRFRVSETKSPTRCDSRTSVRRNRKLLHSRQNIPSVCVSLWHLHHNTWASGAVSWRGSRGINYPETAKRLWGVTVKPNSPGPVRSRLDRSLVTCKNSRLRLGLAQKPKRELVK